MKRINYFTLAALAMLSLAGCTQDDERAADLPMTGMPLRPVAHVDAPVTREAMTTETLDHYYFRVADADGGTDEYDYFTTMTLEDGQWKADQEMTWQSTFPKVSAMEQKGVEWSETDYTTGKDITLPADQNTHDNLLKSDVLYMTPTDVTTDGLDDENNIKVNLKHLFAKLKVVVNVTGVPFNPIKSLVIGGTKTTATFTPETGELGEATDEATITACQDGTSTTYECILLPQAVAANTLTVNVTLQDGSTKGYTYPKELELKSNYQYTLSLTMQANMTMTPGDVTMEEGWSDGVVDGEMEEGAEIIDNTYYVKTATGLLQWANAAAEGENPNLTLTANINMEGKTWPVINNYSGKIYGNEHIISNLKLTQLSVNVEYEVYAVAAGFIANAKGCQIRDLTLENPVIELTENGSSDCYTGFFIGSSNPSLATLENSHVVCGSITQGGKYNGGLMGYAYNATIKACSITSTDVLSGSNFGGIAYQMSYGSEITACYVCGGKWTTGSSQGIGCDLREDGYTFTACYWQVDNVNQTSVEGITEVTGETIWSEAMEAMNEALSDEDYEYQWAVNTATDDDPRPLVIKPKTTN